MVNLILGGVTPAPPVPRTVRKVAWATTDEKMNQIIAAQWQQGYRVKRNLPGLFMEFERVK